MEKFAHRAEIKVAVLSGGMSNEREISLRSGKKILSALLRLGFEKAFMIDVKENVAEILQKEKPDVVYNALHGKYGEDGCIQGLLEIMKIPYTGCGVMSSAICMHKDYTKQILKTNDKIKLIKSVLVPLKSNNYKELIKQANLKYPLMLKPVSEGSSIGMIEVESEQELEKAFEESSRCNQDILIEEYIDGISCTTGVLEKDGEILATEVLEFETKTKWYDFKAKYTEGMTKFILPARFSKELTEKIKEISKLCFKTLGCSNVARVDFVVSKDNVPYVLEVNTSPGMTDLSDLPAQANAIGLDYDNLVLTILKGASINKK